MSEISMQSRRGLRAELDLQILICNLTEITQLKARSQRVIAKNLVSIATDTGGSKPS